MPDYARSSMVYREIRSALDPWCKENGYRRVAGTEPAWIQALGTTQDLSFSFRVNPWGGGAIGGNSFHGTMQVAPSRASGVVADASMIRQSDISLCFLQAELDELRQLQTAINRKRPRTAELEAWMREDSPVGEQARQMYSGNDARYEVGDFVTFGYYSIDDVRDLTGFLARYLPGVLVRFTEERCARPKPQPMPAIFDRIARTKSSS
jgi:hypothetical protein